MDEYDPLTPLRQLYPEEVEHLENLNNTCSNWANVWVNTPDLTSSRSIRDCHFEGLVEIKGSFGGFVRGARDGLYRQDFSVRDGLYRSTFQDVRIMAPCLVTDTFLLKRVKIESEAAVIKCGQISSDVDGNSFESTAQPLVLDLGSEVGGRRIRVHPHDTYTAICKQVLSMYRDDDVQEGVPSPLPPDTEDTAPFRWNVVGEGAFLRSCDYVTNCYIGAGSKLINSRVTNCYLQSEVKVHLKSSTANQYVLRQAPEVVECTLHHSILTLATRVSGRCSVKNSVLMECANACDGARVSSCLLGPDSSVGVGEYTNSLIGPMIGCHHQCLLIAVLWPFGRGNMAYGSMLGANHTGRLPDQEALIGEGCFIGLGASAKFPLNLIDAPYSIVAAQTNLLPQRVSMPFSLMCTPFEAVDGMSPAQNSIKPGWVLYNNAYMIARARAKYTKRGRSLDHVTSFATTRALTVLLMRVAKVELVQARPAGDGMFGTTMGGVCEGLGKGVMSEMDRVAGIEAYRKTIVRWSLEKLLCQHWRDTFDTETTNLRSPPIRETREFWTLFSSDAMERVQTHRGQESAPLESILDLIRSQELRYFSIESQMASELDKSELRVAREALLVEVFQHPTLWSAGGFSDAQAALSSPASTVSFLSALFTALSDEWVEAVHACRTKDDVRGARVFDDYGSVHEACDKDAVCEMVDAERTHMQQVVAVTVKTVCS